MAQPTSSRFLFQTKSGEGRSCGELLNIFPFCMMKRLQSLQFLRAVDCSSLEAVFDMEGTNVNVDCSSLGNTFVFPKIIMLALCNLPQLGSFYPGAHTSQWPLLEQLMVSDCHKLDVFAFKTPAFQQRHGEGNLDMPLFLLPHVGYVWFPENAKERKKNARENDFL